ncbi:hypothetical protein DOE05_26390, partial [Escherichia coli]|nr:hypothetical protein [Escherichia coli]
SSTSWLPPVAGEWSPAGTPRSCRLSPPARQLKALSPGRWRHPFGRWMTSAYYRFRDRPGHGYRKSPLWKSASRRKSRSRARLQHRRL